MRYACVVLSLFAAVGCPPPESRVGGTPAGTPTDPVEVCTRVGDVCRYDGSQLGVCNKAAAGKPCPTPGPCFTCVSQH
jgi:hypothetical protein